MKDKLWERFLEWIYKAHQLSKMYKPDRISIELWEEYQKSKRKKK